LRPSLVGSVLASAWPLLVIVGLAVLMQFVVAPGLGEDGAYFTKIILDCGIAIMLGVSLTIVNGFSGQFSMGHAAFMAVGGYAAACIMYYGSARLIGAENFADPDAHGGLISTMILGRTGANGGKPPLVTMADGLFLGSLLAGGLVAAVCGYLVGLPSLRLKGDYLAIVTLGFGEIVRVLIQSQTEDAIYDLDTIKNTPWWTYPKFMGGPVGFSGLPFYSSLFWVYLFCGVTLLTAYRIKESTFGRALLSIREDEVASEAMGVNITRFKIRAFVISAFFAGIAGGLYAHTVGVQLNAGELGFVKSFDIIIMVVLGGLGSISGAAMAAVILTVLPEWLRNPGHMWYFGLGALVCVLIVTTARKQVRSWLWLAVGLALGAAAVAIIPGDQTSMMTRVEGALQIEWSTVVRFVVSVGLAAGGLLALRRAKAVGAGFVVGATFLLEAGRWIAVSQHVELARYRMVFYALALILMMILRPKGLLGVREIWDRSFWKSLLSHEVRA
jgi:branched-chain amino acid transport system permease protein